jgi:hypothetical protein
MLQTIDLPSDESAVNPSAHVGTIFLISRGDAGHTATVGRRGRCTGRWSEAATSSPTAYTVVSPGSRNRQSKLRRHGVFIYTVQDAECLQSHALTLHPTRRHVRIGYVSEFGGRFSLSNVGAEPETFAVDLR